MDKIDSVITSLNHSITINERKNIIITGVKKIESFDEEEFFMETSMGIYFKRWRSRNNKIRYISR